MRWATVPEWKLAVSVVPALISVLTIELLVAPELVDLLVDRLVQGVEAQPRFAPGVIMMSALTVCYVAICLALLGYSCHGIATSTLPPERKRRLAVAGIATWIGFHVALVGLGAVDLQIYSVVYGSIVQVYQAAGEPVAAAMTGDAGLPGVSRHLMAILLPVTFGVAAVCSGSCHAIAIVEDAASPSRDSGQAARNAADRLVRCLIAMSALLVGSTLLLTLYFRLPLALYGAGEAGSAVGADYLDFANVASISRGAFTRALARGHAAQGGPAGADALAEVEPPTTVRGQAGSTTGRKTPASPPASRRPLASRRPCTSSASGTRSNRLY